MGKHQFAKIFLIFLTFAVHMAMLGVSYLAVFPEKSRGLFTSETGNISHKYDLAAVPDDSAFSIWGAIYLSEALWLLYAITTVFRSTSKGPLYVSCNVMPSQMLIGFILNCIINIIWLIAFDREKILYSGIIISFLPLCLIYCLVLSHRRLHSYSVFMIKESLLFDIWINRFLVQNGIAVNATWVSIATCLNFGMVLTYVYDVKEEISSIIVLMMVSIGTLLYTCFDYKRKLTHYTVTPYMVVSWATVGVLLKHASETSWTNITILSVVLLVCTCIVLGFKVFSILFPLKTDRKSKAKKSS
ncbi:uncharacterized protein LOC115209776 [Octopus sinensis]|uniref:Uncharacterized protein LOC115209776 n=1 Tax=Octopus sinensis TaxID=2607531 RepID=A0A6P7S7S1_9MOLL|nr:uncharacterized protein LOC115209776 [Octopus sinensis]XP_029634152.1 uncharacterized protein LOC115209776 [Octopus sinensis]XP_036357012.1 uncharacterized protein LOC115209776 [Octopus sinensis]